MQQDIGGERISLSTTSCAYQPCYIGKNLNIGDNVSIGSMCHIGRNVTIGNHSRDRPTSQTELSLEVMSLLDQIQPSLTTNILHLEMLQNGLLLRSLIMPSSVAVALFYLEPTWAINLFLAEVLSLQSQFQLGKSGQEIQRNF